MKKIILALLTGLILLSACGKKDKPRLESFAGEAIATIQNQNLVTITLTDIFPTQWTPVVVANTPVVVQSVFPTNQVETDIASDSYPVPVPGSEVTPTTKTPTIIVSQSSPYPIGTSETPKPSPTVTQVPKQTHTATSVPFEWAGEWHIWFQNTTGKYVHSIMTLTVIGDKVFGNATIEGVAYTFEGTINQNKEVSGEWRTADRTVRFWWDPKDTNQFLGSWAERFGFCGNKLEAVQPENCRKTPTR